MLKTPFCVQGVFVMSILWVCLCACIRACVCVCSGTCEKVCNLLQSLDTLNVVLRIQLVFVADVSTIVGHVPSAQCHSPHRSGTRSAALCNVDGE